MKKLVFVAVAIVAVSFASCGNKAANADAAAAEEIRVNDSIEAVKAAEACCADSANCDSTKACCAEQAATEE